MHISIIITSNEKVILATWANVEHRLSISIFVPPNISSGIKNVPVFYGNSYICFCIEFPTLAKQSPFVYLDHPAKELMLIQRELEACSIQWGPI